jgi:hemerythrin superfamily protein
MPTAKRSVAKQPSVRHIKRAAGIAEPKNAIQLLKADHREVEGLFKTFKSSKSAAEKQSLAKKICEALKIHMRIEEEIFYPAFIQATDNKELHNEALVEHEGAKRLIEDIEDSGPSDPLFDARIKVLAEMIKHHVKEEERFTGMFLKARVAGMDLQALGVLLEARKQELSQAPKKRRTKTPPETQAAFMGAAALARSRSAKVPARRAPDR